MFSVWPDEFCKSCAGFLFAHRQRAGCRARRFVFPFEQIVPYIKAAPDGWASVAGNDIAEGGLHTRAPSPAALGHTIGDASGGAAIWVMRRTQSGQKAVRRFAQHQRLRLRRVINGKIQCARKPVGRRQARACRVHKGKKFEEIEHLRADGKGSGARGLTCVKPERNPARGEAPVDGQHRAARQKVERRIGGQFVNFTFAAHRNGAPANWLIKVRGHESCHIRQQGAGPRYYLSGSLVGRIVIGVVCHRRVV